MQNRWDFWMEYKWDFANPTVFESDDLNRPKTAINFVYTGNGGYLIDGVTITNFYDDLRGRRLLMPTLEIGSYNANVWFCLSACDSLGMGGLPKGGRKAHAGVMQDNPYAMLFLAENLRSSYEDGRSEDRTLLRAEAKSWYKRAFEHDLNIAIAGLGHFSRNSDNMQENLEKVIALYKPYVDNDSHHV